MPSLTSLDHVSHGDCNRLIMLWPFEPWLLATVLLFRVLKWETKCPFSLSTLIFAYKCTNTVTVTSSGQYRGRDATGWLSSPQPRGCLNVSYIFRCPGQARGGTGRMTLLLFGWVERKRFRSNTRKRKYRWPLENAGIRGANSPCSKKSAYNFWLLQT